MQIVAERPDGLKLLRLHTPEDGAPWLAALAGAYQEIWSEPPYNERFSSEEASAVLQRTNASLCLSCLGV